MFLFQSVNVPLTGAVESCVGGRSQNQDDFGMAETPLGFVAIVCDGMGGGPGGKTASAIVKQTVLATLCGCNQLMDRVTALKMAVSRANDALNEAVRRAPELAGMGSTLVAVLIDRQSALVAHVGDSRCYRLHGGRVKFCTEDHSLVAELVKKRVMTVEQARVSPQSNVITRHLGNPVNNTPQIDEVPYCRGDRFVLCTDGVWGCMAQTKLTAAMAETGSADSVVERLAQQVDSIGFAEGGGHDNHTVLIIDIAADSGLARKAATRRKRVFASAVGALGVAATVALVCTFRGCGTQSEDEAALQRYTVGDGPSYIFDGRATPGEITDSVAADSAKDGAVRPDSTAVAQRLEEMRREKHHRDSLREPLAKAKETKGKGKEAGTEGKEKASRPTGKSDDAKEQKAAKTIGAIKEKLKLIKDCKKKQAEDVTKANTANVKDVKKQLEKLKALDISRWQDFIKSVCNYVDDKNNTALLTRPSEKLNKEGFYTTERVASEWPDELKRISSDLRRNLRRTKKTINDRKHND